MKSPRKALCSSGACSAREVLQLVLIKTGEEQLRSWLSQAGNCATSAEHGAQLQGEYSHDTSEFPLLSRFPI